MCKSLPPAKNDAEREQRKRIQAASFPGVREYGRLIAEARRLAFEINHWLEQNPVCELTETNLALMVAVRDDLVCDDVTPDHHRALSGMAWAMDAGVEFLTGTMLHDCFPACFERLDLSKRSRRKPSRNRVLALTA